jgi:energy-converting hydrogenase Eha subunit A
MYVFAMMSGTLASGQTGSTALDYFAIHIIGYLWISCVMGLWVAPTWLLLVLPLALFVPERSKFWHPSVIGPVGLVSGGVIFVASLLIIARGNGGDIRMESMIPVTITASTVGLLTALMLAYLFRKRKEPIQAPQTTVEKSSVVSDLNR